LLESEPLEPEPDDVVVVRVPGPGPDDEPLPPSCPSLLGVSWATEPVVSELSPPSLLSLREPDPSEVDVVGPECLPSRPLEPSRLLSMPERLSLPPLRGSPAIRESEVAGPLRDAS